MKLRHGLALTALMMIPASASAAVRTVALSGQQAPGAAAGANFSHLYYTPPTPVGPVINDAGQVAFAGQTLTGGGATSTGVWSETGGALALVALSGTQAPGTSAGVNFATLKNPLLNDAGQTAFDGTVDSAAATNAALWSQSGGSLNLIARKGSPAPGAGANFLALFELSLGDGGQTAFRGQLGGAGVTAANDDGIWAEKSSGLTLMARAGSPAPGTTVNFDRFPASPILINSTGQIAFRGFLTGAGVTTANDVGIWAERSGSLALVAREGGAVPRITGATFSFIDLPVFNRQGQTAFQGLLGGVPAATNAAVFSEGVGTLATVARKGNAAPGTPAGVNFNNFDSVLLNGEGQVAFGATLTGGVTTNDDSGLWANRGGELALVAREGAQAPGAAAGQLYSAFTSPVLNGAGQLAFTATLMGAGIVAGNDRGLWAQGLAGDLRLIAREGDSLEVSPGVTRTISELTFVGGVNTEDGRRSGFNDLGEIAFLASFTDGTSGVFASDAARAMAADFDGDADVDGADLLTWQRGFGRIGTGLPNNGDANADGDVSGADLTVWRSGYGIPPATVTTAAVPEPGSLALLVVAASCVIVASRFRPA